MHIDSTNIENIWYVYVYTRYTFSMLCVPED